MNPSSRARRPCALLIIDMINTFAFEGGVALERHARKAAPQVEALRRRWTRAGQPVVFCNDNFGQWRSDFRAVVAACAEDGARGRAIAQLLQPQPDDYFVLKPKHSAFHGTPLYALLKALDVQRLVLTGIASDSCVLYTAFEAHMREYQVEIAADASATQSAVRHRRALACIEQAGTARIRTSARLRP